ncbi:MAG: hypothetical protein Q8O67_27205 [Deltaproteobacteria bacterium]|nr:hypothetical protein [Deltaproteobacteria bacterium]
MDPTKHRVLLVGPRVVHLRSFFEKRRYPVVAAGKGVEGMAQLDTSPCDIVVLELNLGDLTATEFLMAARQGHPRSTFLLLDESTKAGQIVKALQAGLDGYLATPPDEERLFYEVERHLLRGTNEQKKPAAPTSSGFDDDASTQTAMSSMAEAAALALAVADRESQVIELQEQLGQAQLAMRNLREDARRLEEVQQALGGVVDGPLDATRAGRLREQVQLAQVGSIEIDSLRDEAKGLRDAKARVQGELDQALRDLRQARSDAAEPVEDKTARVDELEAEVMVLEGRVSEAEDAAAAAKEALSVSEDESEEALADVALLRQVIAERDARIAELDEQAAAIASSSSSRAADQLEHERALAAQRTAHEQALATEKTNHEKVLAALTAHQAGHEKALVAEQAKHAAAVAAFQETLESERAAHEQALSTSKYAVDGELAGAQQESNELKAAVARALKEAEEARAALEQEKKRAADDDVKRAATEKEAEQRRAALEKQVLEESVQRAVTAEAIRLEKAHATAMTQAKAAVAGDVDKKLEVERTRLARETRDAVDKATDSELQLEEARMRIDFLEEEAKRVASGSNDDVMRIQREADERIKEIEAGFKKEKLRLVDEKQSAASGSQEAAVRIEKFSAENALLKRQNAELIGNKSSLEIASTAAVERARVAAEDAARAREEAVQALARANDVADAQQRVEAAMGAVQAHARSLEEDLAFERARADDAAQELARIPELQAEHERALAAAEAAARAAVVDLEAAHAAALAAKDAAHAEALKDTSSSSSADVDAARSALLASQEKYEAQLAEQRVALEEELSRVRSEAQSVHAQASQFVADLQRRTADLEPITAERNDLRARLQNVQAEADQQRAQLLVQLNDRQATVDSLQDQLAVVQSMTPLEPVGNGAESESLRVRIAELERMASSDPAVLATVRSLVEAIEPLRWGLGSAIDYMYPFEQNDQSLATHVRNLRLLQATLARLAVESGTKNGA